MESQRTRIQNFLQNTAAAFDFPTVDYDTDDSEAQVSDTETINPSTCKANEVGTSYVRDDNQGRRVVRRRDEWRFELNLKFRKEVRLAGLEESLTDPVIRMDPTTDHLGVLLELDTIAPVHPAQHSPKTGTEAQIIFIATEMRR